MPRRYSTVEVERFLLRNGFAFQRQRGSHRHYRGTYRGAVRSVALVAGQKQIPDGTLSSIAAQLGIATRELKMLLDSA